MAQTRPGAQTTQLLISLFQLDSQLILVILAVMVFAGLVHGTLGLGFPMVATPIIAIFLDVRLAILLTLLPTAAVNLAVIFSGPDYLPLVKRFLVLVLCSVIGSLIGSQLLSTMDPNPLRMVLAALILLFLASSHLGKLPKQWLQRHAVPSMIFFGLLAGLSAGTTNVMVAVLIIYFLSLELPRDEMVPVLNTCFLAGKLAQIVIFLNAGLVSVSSMAETIPLAGAALIALFVGQKIQHRISVTFYRRVLHLLLVLLAVILLLQFFSTPASSAIG